MNIKLNIKLSILVVIISILFSGFCFAKAHTRTEWVTMFDDLNARSNKGLGYSQSNDSGVLAWNESYLLRAYLNMYEATEELKYLDSFVTHMNNVINNMNDENGDGFLGWNTSRYSVQLVQNGTAEKEDQNLPDKWKLWPKQHSLAFRDENNAASGKAGFTIISDGKNDKIGLESTLYYVNNDRSYEAGVKYLLKFKAKTSSNTGWRLEVIDTQEKKIIFEQEGFNKSWQTYNKSFIAPIEKGHNITIRLLNADTKKSGGAHFDNITVKQFAEYFVHDGMLASPMARFIFLAKQHKLPTPYLKHMNQYSDIVENHLIPKWEKYLRVIDDKRMVYITPDDGSFKYPNNSLPHNQYLAMTTVYTYLARAFDGDKRKKYKKLAEGLANTFKGALRKVHANGDAYEWNYGDDILASDNTTWSSLPEDRSHANIDIAAIVNLHKAGIVFSSDDITYVTNTLLNIMWNGDEVNPNLGKYVNTARSGSQGYHHWGWIQLGEYNKETFKIVQTIYDNYWDDLRARTSYMLVISEIIKGIDKGLNIVSPSARFSMTATMGKAPLSISFDFLPYFHDDEIAITQYNWDFGDGVNNIGESVRHTYDEAGIYTVKLAIQDMEDGRDSTTKTISVWSPELGENIFNWHIDRMSVEQLANGNFLLKHKGEAWANARKLLPDLLPEARVVVKMTAKSNPSGGKLDVSPWRNFASSSSSKEGAHIILKEQEESFIRTYTNQTGKLLKGAFLSLNFANNRENGVGNILEVNYLSVEIFPPETETTVEITEPEGEGITVEPETIVEVTGSEGGSTTVEPETIVETPESEGEGTTVESETIVEVTGSEGGSTTVEPETIVETPESEEESKTIDSKGTDKSTDQIKTEEPATIVDTPPTMVSEDLLSWNIKHIAVEQLPNENYLLTHNGKDWSIAYKYLPDLLPKAQVVVKITGKSIPSGGEIQAGPWRNFASSNSSRKGAYITLSEEEESFTRVYTNETGKVLNNAFVSLNFADSRRTGVGNKLEVSDFSIEVIQPEVAE